MNENITELSQKYCHNAIDVQNFRMPGFKDYIGISVREFTRKIV